MKEVSRYHPLLVTLHWLLAILIVGALTLGYFVIVPMPNSDPRKIGLLMLHMAGGMLILVLMAIRFIIRKSTSKPREATTGYPNLDRIAPVTHYGFYVLVVLMVAGGLTTAVLSGLNLIVFGRSGEPLPPTLTIYPSYLAHGYLAAIMAAFIALHLVAALHHQFVMNDRLFRRMWFGRRGEVE